PRRHGLDDVEAPPQQFPTAARLPVLGSLGVLRLQPGPTLVAPERAIPIAAGGDEGAVFLVRHERTVDRERRDVDVVRGQLVVVGPRLLRGPPAPPSPPARRSSAPR